MNNFLIFSLLVISSLAVDNPGFVKIGQFNGSTYFVPRYFRVKWIDARIVCKTYGYDLASLETIDEVRAVQNMCKNNKTLFDMYTHIDGISTDTSKNNSWYLGVSGKKIDYNIEWAPGQPDNFLGLEYFLSLVQPDFLFNDIFNFMEAKFICEMRPHCNST